MANPESFPREKEEEEKLESFEESPIPPGEEHDEERFKKGKDALEKLREMGKDKDAK